ncbi:MAG: hypothetical protein AAF420_16385 [Pseudomonadota bacterium]
MDNQDSRQIESIAQSILRYLENRPEASETAEGVAQWWLSRQRYDDSLELIEKALDYLESRGDIEKINVAGGHSIYKKSETGSNNH